MSQGGDVLDQIESQLQTATSFLAVFGMLTTVSPAHRLKELRQKFAHLAKMVHPDTVSKEYADKAGEVFNKLVTVKEAAETAILEGTYDEQFVDTFVLKSRKEIYECQEGPYKKGDFSSLYKAKNSRSEAVLVKIATRPPHNPWLEKERAFARANKDKYIPGVIDSFFVMDGRSRFQALVMPHLDGYVSLTDILHSYPKGLGLRDAAWICRRVMGQAVLARGLGIVHTAIVPDHVLVHVRSHDPLHLGWGHAVKIKDRTHLLIEKWKNLYPPEMLDRKKVNQKADVFMAAQTMLLLFGKNKLPKGIERVLSRCTETSPSKRPKAYEALKDLTKVIRSEWGKKYRNLKMPRKENIMGGGSLSSDSYVRASSMRHASGIDNFDYDTKVRSGKIKTVHEDLDPTKMNNHVRESRDSDEHPESLPIAVIFDVTGSMGSIPRTLQEKLPSLMDVVIDKAGIKHPQVLVGAIGDYHVDQFPFQIGQFESDNRFDEQLRNIILEGGGGGQIKESYGLAFRFAARHTETDSFEKRGKKGYLFTMGDESFWPSLESAEIKSVFGVAATENEQVIDLIKEAQEKWELFHLFSMDGSYPHHTNVHDSWREVLGERFVAVEDSSLICEIIASLIYALESSQEVDDVVLSLGLSAADQDKVKNAIVPVVNAMPSTSAAEGTLPAGHSDTDDPLMRV